MPVVENREHDQHALPSPPPQQSLPQAPADPEPKGRGGLVRKLLLAIILIAACAFGWSKYKANQQDDLKAAAKTYAAANRAIPISTATASARTMPIYLTALGTVTAYNTVTVKSRVDGQLLSVNVREGQQVKQGQLLAQIDPGPYQAALAQAQGQLAKDTASAEYANAESARYKALYDAGVVSKDSEQVQISTAGASQGTLLADKAAIQAAKVNTAYTRILSPINGVVGLRQVDAGNIVHAADTNGLLVVTQLQPIAVIFTLPEDQLPEVLKLIRSGRKLAVEAYDRSESTHLASGTLLTADNQIDTTTGTVKIKAVFNNPDGLLFPNQFVNVRLILEERQNSLVIPGAALETGSSGTFVYTVKKCPDAGCPKPEKTASETSDAAALPPVDASDPDAEPKHTGPQYYADVQPVVVELTEGQNVILKSGLNPGDTVVTDGQEKLKKYSRVSPKQAKAKSTDLTTAPSAADAAASDSDTQPKGAARPNAGQNPEATAAHNLHKEPKDTNSVTTGHPRP